ncbi:putative protein phosphatase 2C 55-like [Hibiscus syriacus]|uniref:Chloroplastic lipocalin n=1 Tax=Hibiscus syriacus TaxID=106335 RepID=A0A6A2XKA0_HIBSY|nr:putative protein phosphatase 2C 55-like [Hibiscus syriacus]
MKEKNGSLNRVGLLRKLTLNCSIKSPPLSKVVASHTVSGLASLIFLSQTSQLLAADLSHHPSICQLASSMDNKPILPLEEHSGEGNEMLMMMRGMTAKNFDPVRYSGRWLEVASLKRGFAGQGQEDCHCTQGVYKFNMKTVHGGPDGYITGIRGKIDSGTPNPGREFIDKYKSYLANFVYDPSKIKDTPQDCQVMSNSQLAAMMSMSGMQKALTNQFPDLELKASVEL